MDVGNIAVAAGAPFAARASAYDKDLPALMEQAIRFEGFSIIDIQGICPGRYLKQNKLSPKLIDENLSRMSPLNGPVPENARPEYGSLYRKQAASQEPIALPAGTEAQFRPPQPGRQEVVILGSAGQHILTAGEILGMGGLTAGLNVTQKNDYNVTVLEAPLSANSFSHLKKLTTPALPVPLLSLCLLPKV